MKQFLFVLLAVFTMIACKKDNEGFNPVGYWRGLIDNYHLALLNEQGGKSSLYIAVQGHDTANALQRVYGQYEVHDGKFHAVYGINGTDTIYMDSYEVSNKKMSGLIIVTGTAEAYEFELHKQ